MQYAESISLLLQSNNPMKSLQPAMDVSDGFRATTT